MPSWIAPTMAIAPMHTVSDAVTNPLTNPASPSLPVLARSQTPNCSKRASRSIASPMTAPTARLMRIVMVPPEESAELPSEAVATASIFSMAPPMPRKRTARPQAWMSASCSFCVMRRRPSRPTTPPTTMQHTLMMVPRPCTRFAPFVFRGYGIRGLASSREVVRVR